MWFVHSNDTHTLYMSHQLNKNISYQQKQALHVAPVLSYWGIFYTALDVQLKAWAE